MAKHRAGGKCSDSHTTVTDGAAVVVSAAQKHESVTKIVLGIMKSKKGGGARLNFKEIKAGWEITVISASSVQTLYVYTSDRVATRDALFRSWSDR